MIQGISVAQFAIDIAWFIPRKSINLGSDKDIHPNLTLTTKLVEQTDLGRRGRRS
jgi:hypothetical protein